jgi:hypothetical protein
MVISRKKLQKNKVRKTTKSRKSSSIQGKRFPKKNGWIRMCVWGNAFERGYAHGYLLAKELLEIFNQNEWMDDSVDFVLDDGNEEPKNASVFLNDVLKEKDNTIEELKKKITELENQLKNKL